MRVRIWLYGAAAMAWMLLLGGIGETPPVSPWGAWMLALGYLGGVYALLMVWSMERARRDRQRWIERNTNPERRMRDWWGWARRG